MGTIVLYGEDNLSLDKYLLEFKKQYSKIEYLEELNFAQIQNQLLSLGFFPDNQLFIFKNVFVNQVRVGKVSQNLDKILNLVKAQQVNSSFVFIEESANKLKYYKQYFPKAVYKEFKITLYLFYFLDNFKPQNLTKCLSYYQKAKQKNAPELIFYLLKRRVKELLALSTNSLQGHYQSWQLAKLKGQLSHWSQAKLVKMYKAFYRMERGIKSGNSPMDTEKSLEILLGLYL